MKKFVNRFEEIDDAMNSNKARYQQRLAEIRTDNHYSQQGKSDLIATAYSEYQRVHESLKDERRQLVLSERAELEKFAFSAPRGQETSYRDAIARASSFKDSAERSKALGLALKTGDTIMVRAIAAISHGLKEGEESWHTVVEASKHDRDIAKLIDFEREHGSLRTPGMILGKSLAYNAPEQPREAQQAQIASERTTVE